MGGSNIYAYALNPIVWIDPYGLSPKNTNKKKAEGSEAEETCPLPEMVEMYHYTDLKGYNAIRATNPLFHFKAFKPNAIKDKGVYLTPKSAAEMREKDAGGIKKALGVTADKTKYYFHFKVDKCKLKPIAGGRSHVVFSPNDLFIPKSDMLSYGETPKEKWNE